MTLQWFGMAPNYYGLSAQTTTPIAMRKPVDNLVVLQKLTDRLNEDLSPETRTRLESVIATYQRLYVAG